MADSSIDSHIKAYADLFIEKFESIHGDWRKPWLPTLPFSSQNAAGHLYSGVNDVNLSLTCALRGFSCPVWLTGSQCRDLGVMRLAGEGGSIVYWGGTSFFDKEKGAVDPQMRWAEYQKMTPEEKERFSLKESTGNSAYVWNLQQTDFPDRHPDSWANLKAAFSRERFPADVKKLDDFIRKGDWRPDGVHRCPIVESDCNAAHYDRSVRYIEVPKKELFMDERNFYSTLLHTMAHSAIIEQAVATHKGEGDPLADMARLNLSSELAAAVVAGRLGLNQSLSKESLQYLREWTQVLSDDPGIIRQVTKDARHAVETISGSLGISPAEAPDICTTLGKEITKAREARKSLPQRHKRKVFDSRNERTGKPRLTRGHRGAHL